MIWESSGIEKNFDELIEEVEKVKGFTLKKIKKLEDTSIKKIQQIKQTFLSQTNVNIREESSWYSKSKYLVITTPDKLLEKVEDKTLLKKFQKGDIWSNLTLTLTISEKNEELFKEYLQILEVIHNVDQSTHKENLQIVEDNKKISSTIFNVLELAGIRQTFYDYKTNRSSKKTEQHYKFTSEIRNQIPMHYPENSLDERKKSLTNQIKKYWDSEISKVKEEQRKKEQEQKEKEENKKLALLLAKYDLDLTDEWSDIQEAIIRKDKYLFLAHYLELNRGDWSDGHDYASRGLDGFSIETELDQKIYDDIMGYIENWDGDGRVFRDCEYNYSVLYGMVDDANLLKDYETVNENIERW